MGDMRVMISGRVYELTDMGSAMNEAFLDLYKAVFDGQPYDLEEFDRKATKFFGNVSSDPVKHDAFFGNLTHIWKWYLENGKWFEAEHLWLNALLPALSWEGKNKGQFIHKGTPYYFWGMTSIIMGDLDRGFALMHQALEEDIRRKDRDWRTTPAFAFATLKYTEVNQAFGRWVLYQAEFLDELLKLFCTTHGRQLTLGDFKRRFLENPPNYDTVFMFAYALARLFRHHQILGYAASSTFAAQLKLNLLFDIALVIEALIKAKNPNQGNFIVHAAYLAEQSSLGLTMEQLGQINSKFINDFEPTLKALISNTFSLDGGRKLSRLESELAIAYGIRNHGAHNVTAIPTFWEQFTLIRQSLFNILFLCVEVLYK
ncbi:hypothetical protein HYR54_14955 [Candidatus Acetothermia bacterium]|nr:hypothetical protein [Candidatus Acetothermia bacterium]